MEIFPYLSCRPCLALECLSVLLLWSDHFVIFDPILSFQEIFPVLRMQISDFLHLPCHQNMQRLYSLLWSPDCSWQKYLHWSLPDMLMSVLLQVLIFQDRNLSYILFSYHLQCTDFPDLYVDSLEFLIFWFHLLYCLHIIESYFHRNWYMVIMLCLFQNWNCHESLHYLMYKYYFHLLSHKRCMWSFRHCPMDLFYMYLLFSWSAFLHLV